MNLAENSRSKVNPYNYHYDIGWGSLIVWIVFDKTSYTGLFIYVVKTCWTGIHDINDWWTQLKRRQPRCIYQLIRPSTTEQKAATTMDPLSWALSVATCIDNKRWSLWACIYSAMMLSILNDNFMNNKLILFSM